MTVGISVSVADGAREVVIDYKQMGDVFYIDMNACVVEPETDAAVKALSDAVKAGTTKAKRNPAIQLVVLTDAQTFSSATMMGVFVQDGKLGTVIGRASSNAPNSYGDVLSYTLPNSQFSGGVSYKQWQRPDTTADQKTLVPDVETALSEDTLETALSFLNGKSH